MQSHFEHITRFRKTSFIFNMKLSQSKAVFQKCLINNLILKEDPTNFSNAVLKIILETRNLKKR